MLLLSFFNFAQCLFFFCQSCLWFCCSLFLEIVKCDTFNSSLHLHLAFSFFLIHFILFDFFVQSSTSNSPSDLLSFHFPFAKYCAFAIQINKTAAITSNEPSSMSWINLELTEAALFSFYNHQFRPFYWILYYFIKLF